MYAVTRYLKTNKNPAQCSSNIHPIILHILVQEVQEEGKYAIDSPGSPITDLPPEEYNLGVAQRK